MSDSGREQLVLTKAALLAADQLQLEISLLAKILGQDLARAEDMKKGIRELDPGKDEWEASLLLVRTQQALLGILGDVETARAWMTSENRGLGGRPMDLMMTRGGLASVVLYLESSRP